MKIASIAICRVSTSEQTENGSLSRQELNVRKAADLLNAPIINFWSGDVSSRAGKNLDRKDLQEMLQFCKEHKEVKFVIIDEVDRFMRSIDEFFWYKVELDKLGVKLHFASTPELNDNTTFAKLNRLLKVYQAEASNDERIDKSINGLKARVLLGYSPVPTHPGYMRTSIPGLHEPDLARFTILQSIIQGIISGKFTVYSALEELNAQGYTTISGKKLKMDKFRKILTDDYYAGLVTIKKWDDPKFQGIKGLHKAMITPDEHEILKSIVTGKKRVFERKKENKDFPLGNVGLCECGGKLVGFNHRNGKGWTSPKYRCRACGRQYHADKLHSSLDEMLNKVRVNQSEEDNFVNCLTNAWKEEEVSSLMKIKSLETRKERLNEERNQIARKLALNTDKELEADIESVLKKTKCEIDALDANIAESKDIDKDLDIFIRFSLRLIGQKLIVWKALSRADRVKCKQLIFPGGIIVNSAEKVCTPQISPIIWFASNKKEPDIGSDSHLVELTRIALVSKENSSQLLTSVKFAFVFSFAY